MPRTGAVDRSANLGPLVLADHATHPSTPTPQPLVFQGKVSISRQEGHWLCLEPGIWGPFGTFTSAVQLIMTEPALRLVRTHL